MIDIFFSASASGTYYGSSIHPDEKNVFHLDTYLDIGQLQAGYECDFRREMYNEIFWSSDPMLKDREPVYNYYNNAMKSYKQVLDKIKHGEPIRIWQDDNARALCELMHLCNDIIKINSDAEIYVVDHPSTCEGSDRVYVSKGWAEFENDAMIKEITKKHRMSYKWLKTYSDKWNQLIKENADLRVMIDGNIVSVNADFYDPFILRYMGKDAIKESEAVWNLIDETGFSMVSQYAFYRIEWMIEQGMIEVVEESSDPNRHTQQIIRRN